MSNDDSRVTIEHAAILNKRTGGAWLPVIWVNGKLRGSTWSSRGYGRDAARVLAMTDAKEEAGRYGGDYVVTVLALACDHKRRTHEQMDGLCSRCEAL